MTPSSNKRSDLAIGPQAERAMIERIERVASMGELNPFLAWNANVPPRTTPLDDIRALQARLREQSFRMDDPGPLPIVLHRLGHEVASYPGTMDDLLAQLAEQGASSPQPVVLRGVEGHQVGQMVAITCSLGVIVGTADGVSKLLDRT